MKKYNSIIAITIMLFFLSCNESEFLKEKPMDKVYAENVYTTKSGFLRARNGLLALIRSERTEKETDGELSGYLWKVGVDNGIINAQFDWMRPMGGYYMLNPTARVIGSGFNYYFSVVNAANMTINRAEEKEIDWEAGTAEEKEANKMEAIAYGRFARAWAYRFLVFGWGELPISDKEINGTNFRNDWEKASVEEVKSFIIADFEAALPYLANNSEDPQCVAKVVALHYLAEMYLSLYYDHEKNDKESLDKAWYYGNEIVSNPLYKLIENRYGVQKGVAGVAFMDQFYDGNVRPSQGNTEVLWYFINVNELKFNGTYNNVMRRGWVSEYFGTGGWPELVCCPENGGRGISRLSINPSVYQMYETNDERYSEFAVRKYYNVRAPGPNNEKGEGEVLRKQNTIVKIGGIGGAQWDYKSKNDKLASTRKWDWSYPEKARWTASEQLNDQPYLRLAESYLLMAEIEMYRGYKTEAAEWINKIRRRAKATKMATATDITLDVILDERTKELITEEHRRITLARTKTLYERTCAKNPQAAKAYPPGMQPHHVLFPIPQSVIDGNTGKVMLNNEGYR